ncbi:MAG: hypothetical protein OSA37_09060, partial [Flavobacteriales bacterium]|nr:hypothetical protein [Flavobacteriales bacterium]
MSEETQKPEEGAEEVTPQQENPSNEETVEETPAAAEVETPKPAEPEAAVEETVEETPVAAEPEAAVEE